MTQKRKGMKRRESVVVRVLRPIPSAPSELWSIDLIHDVFADGSTFQVLSVLDLYTRNTSRSFHYHALVATMSQRG